MKNIGKMDIHGNHVRSCKIRVTVRINKKNYRKKERINKKNRGNQPEILEVVGLR